MIKPEINSKPSIFGQSDTFDPAAHKPRSGKTFWMASTNVLSLMDKDKCDVAKTIISNSTTSIRLNLKMD